jgi:hypothetical protein
MVFLPCRAEIMPDSGIRAGAFSSAVRAFPHSQPSSFYLLTSTKISYNPSARRHYG